MNKDLLEELKSGINSVDLESRLGSDPELRIGLAEITEHSTNEEDLRKIAVLPSQYNSTVAAAKSDIAINFLRAVHSGLLPNDGDTYKDVGAAFNYQMIITALRQFNDIRSKIIDTRANCDPKGFMIDLFKDIRETDTPWLPFEIDPYTPVLQMQFLINLRKGLPIQFRSGQDENLELLKKYDQLLNLLDTFQPKSADFDYLQKFNESLGSLLRFQDRMCRYPVSNADFVVNYDSRYYGFVRRERFEKTLVESKGRYVLFNVDVRFLSAYNKALMERSYLMLNDIFKPQLENPEMDITQDQMEKADLVLAQVLRPVDRLLNDLFSYVRTSMNFLYGKMSKRDAKPEDLVITAAGDELFGAVRIPDELLEAGELNQVLTSIGRWLADLEQSIVDNDFSMRTHSAPLGIYPSIRIGYTLYDARDASLFDTSPLIEAIIRTDKGIKWIKDMEARGPNWRPDVNEGYVKLPDVRSFLRGDKTKSNGFIPAQSIEEYNQKLEQIDGDTAKHVYKIATYDYLVNSTGTRDANYYALLDRVVRSIVYLPNKGSDSSSSVGKIKLNGRWRKDQNTQNGNEATNDKLAIIGTTVNRILDPYSGRLNIVSQRGGDTYITIS
jgi:hypothetical protein